MITFKEYMKIKIYMKLCQFNQVIKKNLDNIIERALIELMQAFYMIIKVNLKVNIAEIILKDLKIKIKINIINTNI